MPAKITVDDIFGNPEAYKQAVVQQKVDFTVGEVLNKTLALRQESEYQALNQAVQDIKGQGDNLLNSNQENLSSIAETMALETTNKFQPLINQIADPKLKEALTVKMNAQLDEFKFKAVKSDYALELNKMGNIYKSKEDSFSNALQLNDMETAEQVGSDMLNLLGSLQAKGVLNVEQVDLKQQQIAESLQSKAIDNGISENQVKQIKEGPTSALMDLDSYIEQAEKEDTLSLANKKKLYSRKQMLENEITKKSGEISKTFEAVSKEMKSNISSFTGAFIQGKSGIEDVVGSIEPYIAHLKKKLKVVKGSEKIKAKFDITKAQAELGFYKHMQNSPLLTASILKKGSVEERKVFFEGLDNQVAKAHLVDLMDHISEQYDNFQTEEGINDFTQFVMKNSNVMGDEETKGLIARAKKGAQLVYLGQDTSENVKKFNNMPSQDKQAYAEKMNQLSGLAAKKKISDTLGIDMQLNNKQQEFFLDEAQSMALNNINSLQGFLRYAQIHGIELGALVRQSAEDIGVGEKTFGESINLIIQSKDSNMLSGFWLSLKEINKDNKEFNEYYTSYRENLTEVLEEEDINLENVSLNGQSAIVSLALSLAGNSYRTLGYEQNLSKAKIKEKLNSSQYQNFLYKNQEVSDQLIVDRRRVEEFPEMYDIVNSSLKRHGPKVTAFGPSDETMTTVFYGIIDVFRKNLGSLGPGQTSDIENIKIRNGALYYEGNDGLVPMTFKDSYGNEITARINEAGLHQLAKKKNITSGRFFSRPRKLSPKLNMTMEEAKQVFILPPSVWRRIEENQDVFKRRATSPFPNFIGDVIEQVSPQ